MAIAAVRVQVPPRVQNENQGVRLNSNSFFIDFFNSIREQKAHFCVKKGVFPVEI